VCVASFAFFVVNGTRGRIVEDGVDAVRMSVWVSFVCGGRKFLIPFDQNAPESALFLMGECA
jgi:hypothetical protein